MTKQNVLEGVVAGEYGKPIDLTLRHPNTGVKQDLSSYNSGYTIEIHGQAPNGSRKIQVTGTLPGGGSDSIVRVTWTSSNHPDTPGDWEGQVKFIADDNSEIAKSYPFEMPVQKSITD